MSKALDLMMYINGEWKDASNGARVDVVCPADESVIGSVPQGTKADVAAALESAEAARKSWAKRPAMERAGFISKLMEKVRENKEELARILSMEQGKPINEARGEIDGTAYLLQYATENAPRIEGDILTSSKQDEQIWLQRVPYGVTVGIIPWNYPLALTARKIGNALVCGNVMIVKPPTVTPLAILKLAELADQCDFPKGVLSFVTGRGSEIGGELVRNPISKLISLTGSTEAGRKLYDSAAQYIKVLRLELGGKAPFLLMDDADIDAAVESAVVSRFTNCGQICICNERMYIHKDVYDAFVGKLIERTRKIKVGPSLAEDTEMGPKVSREELSHLNEVMEKALAQGAKILYQKELPDDDMFKKGYWFMPTILEVPDNSLDIMHEETFGPILPLLKVENFDEALKYGNDCDYGLSAYLYTNDMKKIMRTVNELEFGEIYINRPCGEEFNAFHNGYKISGVGGEDGRYGMEGYLQKKSVYVNYSD